MMNKNLKTLLFGYRTGVEYWLPIKDVVITYNFQLKVHIQRSFGEKYIILK